jgi:hypothetical protein
MTSFPQIDKPCPYVDRLDSVIDGGFCRMCRRDVHDLTEMDEGELTAFLADRGAHTCVTYKMDVKPALAAALIAASAAALVVPDAGMAANHHQSARGHYRARPPYVRRIPVQPALMVTAGMIMPVERPTDPVPLPPPPPSPAPPRKPD